MIKKLISAEVEEYEQGAWVAQLVSIDQFDGAFTFGSIEWHGKMVSERFESERYHTTVIAGAGKLQTQLDDKQYSGSVSLQAAVKEVCNQSGETFGGAIPAVFLPSLERLRGSTAQALDVLANAFNAIWWIDRSGSVQVKLARDPAGVAQGKRVANYSDSVLLVEPTELQIGGTYDGKPVRHIRWLYDADRFAAEVYFLPFIYRPPVDTRYASTNSARVDRDNGDGTIDVIVGGRYGLKKIPLFCGVPGSKVAVQGGEEVTVGYFGGDPQKPYAVSMAQNTSATKETARKGDSVGAGTIQITHVPASGPGVVPCTLAATYTPGSGGPPQNLIAGVGTFTIGEKITSGSSRLKVGD